MSGCCSPFGPAPTPGGGGAGSAVMPLGWSPGLSFSPMVGSSGGFSGPAAAPAAALATSSGSAGGQLRGPSFAPLASLIGGSTLVLGAPVTARAASSGGQPLAFGFPDFSPSIAFNEPNGFQGQAQAFVRDVIVPGGGNIPAQTSITLAVTVMGVLVTDSVYANRISAVFAAGVAIVNSFAGAANQVTLEFMNCTAAVQPIPVNFPLRVGILRG